GHGVCGRPGDLGAPRAGRRRYQATDRPTIRRPCGSGSLERGRGVPGLVDSPPVLQPLLSIVTPSLNQGKYIGQCLASVAAEMASPIARELGVEHIVMDGG